MLKKRLAAGLLTALMAMGTFAGCSGDASSSGSSTGGESSTVKEEGGKTLSMMLATTWNTDALAKGISMYEEATGNKIEVEAVPDDQLTDLIKTRLATSTDVPDIYAGNTLYMDNYFEPLDGEWIDKLTPQFLEGKYRSTDGNVYGAPYGSCTLLGLIYNKKILEENEIEVPIMNYTDWMAACETLKSAGVTPVSLSNKEVWTSPILREDQFPTCFTEEELDSFIKGELAYKDIPRLKQVFTNMLSLKEKNYINEDHMSTTMDMALEDVATGECAMTPAGDWSYSVVQTNFPDEADNIGMMPIPIMDDSIYVNISHSSKYLWVPKSGKSNDVETAKDFVDFILSDETMKAMYEVEPGISPMQDLDVKMTPWGEEMLGYTETIPYVPVVKELSNFNCGDGGVPIQSMYSGKSVEETLEAWYENCKNVNKAAGTEGW